MNRTLTTIQKISLIFLISLIVSCSGPSTNTTTTGDTQGATDEQGSGSNADGGTTDGAPEITFKEVSLENCDQCLSLIRSKYFLPKEAGRIGIGDSVVDGNGNLLITGFFETSDVNFGGNDLQQAKSGEIPGLKQDIFVLKLSPTLEHLWSRRFGSFSTDIAYSVTVDAENNVFFGGYFRDTIKLDETILNFDGQHGFVAKLDGESGNVVWGVKLSPQAPGQVVDQNRIQHLRFSSVENKLLFSGYGIYHTQGDQGDEFHLGYVGALNPENGELIWSQVIKDNFSPVVQGLAVNNQKVTIAGNFRNSLDFEGQSYPADPQKRGLFLIQMNVADGNPNFVKTFEVEDPNIKSSSPGSFDLRLAQDNNGNLIFGGKLYAPTTFGDQTADSEYIGITPNNISYGITYGDLFIVKFDPSGTALWAKGLGKGGHERLFDLHTDSKGDIIFTGNMTVGSESGTDAVAFLHPYLAKLKSSDGSEIFHKEILSSGTGKSIAIRSNDEFIFSGEFQDPLELLGTQLPDATDQGMFIFELLPKL